MSRWGAIGMSVAGHHTQAIGALAKLVERTPHDAQLLRYLASSHEARAQQTDNRLALDYWRRAARSTPPDTPLWYQAKLGIARGLIRLGERQRAVESIRVLQALHPNLGGAAYRERFLELLEEGESP